MSQGQDDQEENEEADEKGSWESEEVLEGEHMMLFRYLRNVSLTVATVAMLVGAASAGAATAPVKEIVSSHIGWEVDSVTKGPICTVASKHACQPAQLSSEPGGFEFPHGVAGAPNGNVYVADGVNDRVQELNANGEFVLMFGKHVNSKGGNVCTQTEIETEHVTCRRGEEARGELGAVEPEAVAVDQSTGNVYVAEPSAQRVSEYTAGGAFVLVIGKEVNQTKKENVCSQVEVELEGVKCQVSAPSVVGATTEHGTFVLPSVVAVGPANNILYVGDEHRVQEFNAQGQWVAEIREPLERVSSAQFSRVSALAVTAEHVYLDYAVGGGAMNVIREFDAAGTETAEFTPTGGEFVGGLAVDAQGRLAVLAEVNQTHRGLLYEVGAEFHLITEFPVEETGEGEPRAVAFNGSDDLYMTVPVGEIVAYEPVPVGELRVAAASCVPGAVRETDVTVNCGLAGSVDPWGVPGTQAWFDWGLTSALGERTNPATSVPAVKSPGEEETPVAVDAQITGLRPNETVFDELAGEDQHVSAPELLTSALASFTTTSVPPVVIGEPAAAFVARSSAVLFGELNPENTNTRYTFQYAPAGACASLREPCSQKLETPVQESAAYGALGAAGEATALQPATTYRYRVFAVNEKSQTAVNQAGEPALPEATFTTPPAIAVQAQTGAASMVGTTSAVLSGVVSSGGQPASYSFEIGVYNPAGTQYGTLFSGSVPASAAPSEQTLPVTGLQPATTYAYRIAIRYGDGSIAGSTATGAPVTFTTEGLPSVLPAPAPLAQLALPNIAFPAEAKGSTKAKALTRAQKLTAALKACHKKAKGKRAGCRKQAHKKYPPAKKKK
jgi:hypothetical protein